MKLELADARICVLEFLKNIQQSKQCEPLKSMGMFEIPPKIPRPASPWDMKPVLILDQQKNMELTTFLCSLGSSCTGTAPATVTPPEPPWLEAVSDISSNFMN